MLAWNLILYAGLLSIAVMLEKCSIRQRIWLPKINTIICASKATLLVVLRQVWSRARQIPTGGKGIYAFSARNECRFSLSRGK